MLQLDTLLNGLVSLICSGGHLLILWFLVSDLKRIRPPEYGRRYVDAKMGRTKDTNQWIFKNEDLSGGNSTLF